MKKGERLDFETDRTVLQAFSKPQEWAEIVVDHPVRHLSQSIMFPAERPCRQATLCYGGRTYQLPVVALPCGATLVRFEIADPVMNIVYRLDWWW